MSADNLKSLCVDFIVLLPLASKIYSVFRRPEKSLSARFDFQWK
jgi:hypothetical protein